MASIRKAVNGFNAKFPLVSMESVSNESDSFNKLVSERQYALPKAEDENTGGALSRVKLGVYNMKPVTSGAGGTCDALVPLDPVCLSTLLILCTKLGTKVPKKSDQGVPSKDASVLVLSYMASPDKELPLLVEDDVDKEHKKIKRKLRSTTVANKFCVANTTGPRETMYVKLLDTRVFDLYISTLLKSNANWKVIRELYMLPDERGSTVDGVYDKLSKGSVLCHLANRFQFDFRNPYIAAQYSGNPFESTLQPKYFRNAVAEEYERCSTEGLETLKSLEDLCTGDFFFGKESVFDLKLAAIVYCITELADDVESFGEIRDACPKLVELSTKVLGEFM